MRLRNAFLSVCAVALTACTTTGSSNPLQARWNGKGADTFFAAYGPPISDKAGSGGSTLYIWRGGFSRGRSCSVELYVDKDYNITRISAVSDRIDPKGGPSHCEKTLDAD